MIALIQRVNEASVTVEEDRVANINSGVLALIGIQRDDEHSQAQRLLERILNYRIFADDQDRMNLSLRDISGDLLLVPQFTLAADTQKGNRPGFSQGACPDKARELFESLCEHAKAIYPGTQTGVFSADMKVGLVNDGPVTFWLEVH